MPQRSAHAALCLILGGVLERHPKLKICLAHGGGAFPFTIGRFKHGHFCRPDLCAHACSTPPQEFLGYYSTKQIIKDP